MQGFGKWRKGQEAKEKVRAQLALAKLKDRLLSFPRFGRRRFF